MGRARQFGVKSLVRLAGKFNSLSPAGISLGFRPNNGNLSEQIKAVVSKFLEAIY